MKKMTEGSPVRLILAFAIPLLIGNIFQQLYSMVDMYIASHTINASALGAIGCTGSISGLVIGFSSGLTSGFCVLTAQHYGAGDHQKMKKSFATGILLSICFIALFTFLGCAFIKPVLRLIKTKEELFSDAYNYIIVIMAGMGATVFYNFFAGILRALGDSRRPLYVLIGASIVNIILDYVFMKFLDMGVRGAALATVISQLLSGIACLYLILKEVPEFRLKKTDFAVSRGDIGVHLRMGFPMGLQWSMISIGQLVLQSALNTLDAAAVTAFTAAAKLDMLAVQPSFSFGSSMSTYVAQNYGAKKLDRIRMGMRRCILISCSICLAMGVINIAFGRYFAGFFVGRNETQIIDYIHTYLIINGSLYFMHALLMIFRNADQGLERPVSTMLAGFMELIMRFVTAWVLIRFFGFTGACFSSPLSWIAAAIPLVISYFMGIRDMKKKIA